MGKPRRNPVRPRLPAVPPYHLQALLRRKIRGWDARGAGCRVLAAAGASGWQSRVGLHGIRARAAGPQLERATAARVEAQASHSGRGAEMIPSIFEIERQVEGALSRQSTLDRATAARVEAQASHSGRGATMFPSALELEREAGWGRFRGDQSLCFDPGFDQEPGGFVPLTPAGPMPHLDTLDWAREARQQAAEEHAAATAEGNCKNNCTTIPRTACILKYVGITCLIDCLCVCSQRTRGRSCGRAP